MPARVSLVTLGVADVRAATAFYESVGFHRSSASVDGDVSFFNAGGVVLGIWGRADLAADAGLVDHNTSEIGGGTSVAMNLSSEAEVDEVWARWVAAGASPIKSPERAPWGGYTSYVGDLDGHLWEIAFNPYWPLRADGTVELPQ